MHSLVLHAGHRTAPPEAVPVRRPRPTLAPPLHRPLQGSHLTLPPLAQPDLMGPSMGSHAWLQCMFLCACLAYTEGSWAACF